MSSYSLQCAIKEVGAITTVGESLKKREILVGFVSGAGKEQTCKFEMLGDKTALVDNYKPGDVVTLHFNLEGREYKDTAFNSLKVWRVEGSGQASPAAKVDINNEDDSDDSLPF